MSSVHSRISAVYDLGSFFGKILNDPTEASEFHSKLKSAEIHNPWFTPENLNYCLKQWNEVLTRKNIENWLKEYKYSDSPKKVGIIMAGNLPLVGLHDLISVILSGNDAIVKTSSKDDVLMSAVIDFLTENYSELKNSIQKTERLKDHDAVIATGSNNTARYFEYYFKDIPHIIRKNRTGVAVLDGSESKQELNGLADDIFRYFGMGCRNVTKLFLPENYNTDQLFESFFEWKDIINHPKYANNYDYNRAVFLLGKEKFLDNNFVMLKESESFHSPIAVVHYSYYKNQDELKNILDQNSEEIQCIVGHPTAGIQNQIGFGQSQKPGLNDYADGVDVMKFLENL
ncbi:MAG: acyl-CoA reductase [Moheibacter sp.]